MLVFSESPPCLCTSIHEIVGGSPRGRQCPSKPWETPNPGVTDVSGQPAPLCTLTKGHWGLERLWLTEWKPYVCDPRKALDALTGCGAGSGWEFWKGGDRSGASPGLRQREGKAAKVISTKQQALPAPSTSELTPPLEPQKEMKRVDGMEPMGCFSSQGQ